MRYTLKHMLVLIYSTIFKWFICVNVPQKSSEGHPGLGASVWTTLWHHNVQTTVRHLPMARAIYLSGYFARWTTGSSSGTHILLCQWRGTVCFCRLSREMFNKSLPFRELTLTVMANYFLMWIYTCSAVWGFRST